MHGDIARALTALGRDGADTMLGDAGRWLQDATDKAGDAPDLPLVAAIDALGRAHGELAVAEQQIEYALQSLAFDPAELDETEERLFAIRALARKHAVQPDDLAEFSATLHQRLTVLDTGEADLEALRRALDAATTHYRAVADRLSRARTKSAGDLDRAMQVELAPLKLERARFTTAVSPAAPGADGQDTVAFTVATNPGAPTGPLDKIASGGELSRFLLALKLCLTADSNDLTMIFDEIDRGVGGATADAVGRRLATLAASGQVLVVTHAPQVAARAAHHWRVEKQVAKGATLSTVTRLGDAGRIDEIARMLAGDTITQEARAAARALLAG